MSPADELNITPTAQEIAAFCAAAGKHDMGTVQAFLTKFGRGAINVQDANKNTALMWASVVRKNADKDEKDKALRTVQLLLDMKADIMIENVLGSKAVDIAKAYGPQSVTNLLLEKEAELKAALDTRLVLRKDASLVAPDNGEIKLEDGLHLLPDGAPAIKARKADMLSPPPMLGDGEPTDEEIMNFYEAIDAGDEAAIKEFIEKHGKDAINVQDHQGFTALMRACCSDVENAEKTVPMLLDMGADITLESKSGLNCMKLAQKNSSQKVVEMLADKFFEMMRGQQPAAAAPEAGPSLSEGPSLSQKPSPGAEQPVLPKKDAPQPPHSEAPPDITGTNLYKVICASWGSDEWLHSAAFAFFLKIADQEKAKQTKTGFQLSMLGKDIKWEAPTQNSPEKVTGVSKGFDLNSAEAMVALSRLRGWRSMDVHGTPQQKDLLWLAIQHQNLLDKELYDKNPPKDKDGNPVPYVPITATNYKPAENSPVYQHWLQEKARYEAENGPPAEIQQTGQAAAPAQAATPAPAAPAAPVKAEASTPAAPAAPAKAETAPPPAAPSKFLTDAKQKEHKTAPAKKPHKSHLGKHFTKASAKTPHKGPHKPKHGHASKKHKHAQKPR